MGNIHSSIRLLWGRSKSRDEEEGGAATTLSPQSHHHGTVSNDNGILSFHTLFCRATKVLFRATFSVLRRWPWKMTSDNPTLPIQNPRAAPISTCNDDPASLVQPLLTSCSDECYEDIVEGHASSQDKIISVPDLVRSERDEIICISAVFITQEEEEEQEEEKAVIKSVTLPIQNPRGKNDDPSLPFRPLLISDIRDNVAKCRVSSRDNKIVSIPEVKKNEKEGMIRSTRPLPISDIRDNVAKCRVSSRDNKIVSIPEVKKNEKKGVIRSTGTVERIRWIKHYSSGHRILLVGDGDFSFSASLAVAFLRASNMIATSLDSEAFLKKNYWNAHFNITELRKRECKVMHGIDATKMADHALLGELKFDRIIYNFPFAGFFRNLPRETQLRRHRRLVSMFLKNAREMLSENGEVHISHKTNGFHVEWKLVSVASSHRLRLIEEVEFNHLDYPGYNTKCGFGGDNNFNCYPSMTYKFGIKC